MRRTQMVLFTMSLVGATACSQGGQSPGTRGSITVNVSCRDQGLGVGVRVHPWKVHTGVPAELTWHLVPENEPMPTELSPVDSTSWPFENPSYSWSKGTQSARLKADADSGTYQYQLKIACPDQTIVIDPIVIIDHTMSTDTSVVPQP